MGDVPAGNFIGTTLSRLPVLWTAWIARERRKQKRCTGNVRSIGYAGSCPQGRRPDNAAAVSRTGARYGVAGAASPSGQAGPNGNRTRSLVEEVDVLASGTAIPCRPASACINSGASGTSFSTPPNRLDGRSSLPGVTHPTRGVGSRRFAVVAIGVSWLERDRGLFALGCGAG